MSMTKSEKAEREALIRDLEMERAMRRSGMVARDLTPPKGFSGVTHGWDFNSYSAGEVFKATSSSVYHRNREWVESDISGGWSQGTRTLFSTELLATKAMRYEIAERYADSLRKIDARISELEKTEMIESASKKEK